MHKGKGKKEGTWVHDTDQKGDVWYLGFEIMVWYIFGEIGW